MTRPCCSLGAHARASDIAAALREGQSVRAVAKAFGVPRSSLQLHARHAAANGGEQEAIGLAGRAEEGRPEPEREKVTIPRARAFAELSDVDFGHAPAGREERVRFIMHFMASGRWQAGMAKAIAGAWGTNLETTEGYANEASRRVKSSSDVDYVRTRLTTALDEALDQARGDPAMVAKVAQAYAPIAQVVGPASVNVMLLLTKGTPAPVWERVRMFLEARAPELVPELNRELAAWSAGLNPKELMPGNGR